MCACRSYIRERETTDGQEPGWYEFNDRMVTPFDPRDIDDQVGCALAHARVAAHTDVCALCPLAQTFGGNYSGMSSHEKSFSAYIVFYERKTNFEARSYNPEPVVDAPKEIKVRASPATGRGAY